MRTFRAFLLLSATLTTGTLRAQQTAERLIVTAPRWPAVQEIVQRAVANDDLRHQHRLALECDQILTTERLDADGAVSKTKTVRLIHREGSEFAFFAKDDTAAANRAIHDGDTVKAEHRMAVMNLRRLAPRYDYSLAEEAQVQGRACFVVAYSPRRGQSSRTPEEKVLDQLHGRFWIDEKTSEILQGEGALAAPVSVGLFASVRAMSFAFHNEKLPNGEVGPADFSVDFTVKAPFYFYRQRQVNRLENWRPVPG